MGDKLFLLSVVLATVLVWNANALDTIKDVEVDLYTGRWYQVYGNFWSNLFADSQQAECTTATYGKINATYVTVFNNYKTREGIEDSINGYAYIPDPSDPGKLLVALDGVLVDSPYWIVLLGPVVDNQYTYSVVSDNRDLSLFVLVRDVKSYYELYDKEMVEYLALTGFNGPTTSPIPVYHGDDCEYPPLK
jgi:lipocalin